MTRRQQGCSRKKLERDAPQSENLHLKEINQPQLSANHAGIRIVGPRGGAESSRHKFLTLGRERSSIEMFGWVSAAPGSWTCFGGGPSSYTSPPHTCCFPPQVWRWTPPMEIFPLGQSEVSAGVLPWFCSVGGLAWCLRV